VEQPELLAGVPLEDCPRLLVALVQSDRFDEGALLEALENRLVDTILGRIEDLSAGPAEVQSVVDAASSWQTRRMVSRRAIRPIPWIPASEVLAHEERDFTVWLADNLALLGETLGLDDVQLIARESRVGSFRADIVASADDGTDDGLPIVIENQYGRTDHAHLGKLITYLAASQRGLGVWIVEEVAEAHRAAVDFLNRTSGESVGFAILVVRFAPGPDGAHYVDFDVVSEPNLWVKPSGGASGTSRGSPERRAFLEEVAELLTPALLEAGWSSVRALSGASPQIRLALPSTHPLQGAMSRTVLRANQRIYTFRHSVRVGSWETSWRIVEALRERYAAALEQELGAEADIRWHAAEGRSGAANDQLRIVHPAGGYGSLEVEEAARWSVHVCRTWLRVTADCPADVLDGASGAQG
jgi:hypothetical protein